jgi:hypothetical protein
MSNTRLAIKYLESLFIVRDGNKFNIFCIARNGDEFDPKKFASSMYATHADIEILYKAYKKAEEDFDKHLKCELSTGTCEFTKHVPSNRKGIVIYKVSIGGIESYMSHVIYNQFRESVEEAYTHIPSRTKLRNKFRALLSRKQKKGLFE